MHQKCKTLLGWVIPYSFTLIAFLLLDQNACAAETSLFQSSSTHPVLSVLTSLYDIIAMIVGTISDLYFTYIHDRITTTIASFWPSSWPQYPAMLATYQGLFHTVPLWFTDTLWPSSLFGKFPRWGIDLFLITEIFYIALRLVTHRAAPFKGNRFVRFLKTMTYESWVFIKAPFFALASVLFFLIKDEEGKRRILLFWLYTALITSSVIALVVWRANVTMSA